MDLGTGALAVANLVRWTLARAWLAVLLAVCVAGLFGAWGRRHPSPDYGTGLTIIDAQMRRSHSVPPADVLVVGDSSSLYGVDAVALEAALPGARVDSLAAIGPARPPGYARLLRNHLDRGAPPRVVLLLLHPLGLMDEVGENERAGMRAVLRDGWPVRSFAEDAVKTLNLRLFGGLLEEPLDGVHGRYYGNGRELRRALDRGRGSLAHPPPVSLPADLAPARQATRFEIHADGERDLAQAASLLRDVDPASVYVGLMPVPAVIAGDATVASRERMLHRTLEILGLPPEQGIDLPAALPNDEFVDPTHPGARGRARLTALLAEIVRERLGGARGGG